MKKAATIFFLIFICTLLTYGQSKSLKAGLDLSSQLGVGYENRFAEGWAVWFQGGVTTFPFDVVVAQAHQLFGASKEQTDLMAESYKLGMVLSFGGQYYFSRQTRKNYFGPVFQWYKFQKAYIQDPLIENYFDVVLSGSGSEVVFGTVSNSESTEPLTLTHSKINTGFLIGRRFNYRGTDKVEFHLEFSLTKTINSNSVIESADYRMISTSFKDRVNNEIKEIYKKHGLLPSVNAYFIYKVSYKRF